MGESGLAAKLAAAGDRVVCLVARFRIGPVGFAGNETGLVSQPDDRLGLENKGFWEK